MSRKTLFLSKYFQALVMAYDPFAPLAESLEELQNQSLLLAMDAEPLLAPLRAALAQTQPENAAQCRFDALMSVAMDVGAEMLQSYPLLELVAQGAPKGTVQRALMEIPECFGTLRPFLADELRAYGLPQHSRRYYEAQLYGGHVTFVVGRRLPPGEAMGTRVVTERGDSFFRFGPSVMHPFLQYFCRLQNP